METKFIEGTNEQYSIREDGKVFCNYIIRYNPKKRIYNKIEKVFELKIGDSGKNKNMFKIRIEGVQKGFSVKVLLFEYFQISICKKCNSKVNCLLKKEICKNCRKLKEKKRKQLFSQVPENIIKRKIYRKKYIKLNYEKNKKYQRDSAKRKTQKITKAYIAGLLKISVSEVSDEIYNHHKELILLKRKIAKENNLNINSLK